MHSERESDAIYSTDNKGEIYWTIRKIIPQNLHAPGTNLFLGSPLPTAKIAVESVFIFVE